MLRGLFVTGTDTNVGKTVVSACLIHRYRGQVPLCYWKPIETGIETANDTAVVRALAECSDVEVFDEGVRLEQPLSPHLAAQIAGQRIDIRAVARLPPAEKKRKVRWIVEGAGGTMVPINDSQQMADLIAVLELPAIIVARSRLGTINHTLLTIEALRSRSLHVVGVVMVGELNRDNRAAIERYGAIPVLGELPPYSALKPGKLREWARTSLDPSNLLMEWLS